MTDHEHRQPEIAISAVLGWANPGGGPSSLRLYALDQGPSPRWANKPHGRTIELALEYHGAHEGDRFLVIRLGDRFVHVDDDMLELALQELDARLDDMQTLKP